MNFLGYIRFECEKTPVSLKEEALLFPQVVFAKSELLLAFQVRRDFSISNIKGSSVGPDKTCKEIGSTLGWKGFQVSGGLTHGGIKGVKI